MTRRRLIVFVALVVLQVLVVGSMARSRETILQRGDQITLETAPVDPRDLFRGDYVVLAYEISTIDTSEVPWNASGPVVGQPVFVVLEEGDGYGRPVEVIYPASGDADFIRGEVRAVHGTTVSLDYGIEEYFVHEGTGWEMEATAIVKGTKNLELAKKVADWVATKGANEIYAKTYAIVALPDTGKYPPNYPANAEKLMIKNDFAWMADNRERILAEWTKRYESKAAPKK